MARVVDGSDNDKRRMQAGNKDLDVIIEKWPSRRNGRDDKGRPRQRILGIGCMSNGSDQ